MDAEQLTTLITAIQKQNEAATKALLAEVVKQLKNESTSGKSTSEPVTLQKFDQFNPKIESFTSYIERFENHLAYINLQDTKKQAQLLCESIGAEHYNNLAAFLGPDNAVSNLTYVNLKEKFKQLLQSKKSTILAQHQFLQQTQSANQTIAEYVAQLQKDIIDCDFYVKCNCQNPSSISIADVFLRCQFIRGIRDNWIRLQLLRSNTTEFDNIVKEALALEASKIESKQFNEIQSSSNTSGNQPAIAVNKIHQSRRYNYDRNSNHNDHNHKYRSKSRPASRNNSKRRDYSRSTRKQMNFQELGIDNHCLRCGLTNHLFNNCKHPAEKFKCNACGRIGHVEKVCISTLMKNRNNRDNRDNSRDNNSVKKNTISYLANDSDDEFDQIHSIDDGSDKIIIPVKINDVDCELECDSGSKKTIVSCEFFKRLNLSTELLRDDTIFRDFQNNYFRPLGYANVTVQYGNRKITSNLYVTDRSKSSVMGRQWLIPLDIIRINEIKSITSIDTTSIEKLEQEFSDVFGPTIGVVPNYEVSYTLKKNAKPIYCKPQKLPYELIPAADRCIDRLVEENILEKVDISEWGTPAVYIEKPDGSLRLCGNYKLTLNKQLENICYQIPTIEDIFQKMENGAYYCKLDLRDAYLHLQVDAETAKMQALSTHRGTYIVKRLYYGTKVAPNIFHRFIDQVVRDLPGTVAYFDDILVQGDTLEVCEQRLRLLLEQLRKNQLHVNIKKCRFFQNEIEYLGHVISKDGLKKSPKKIAAVINAQTPKNTDDIRQFIGLVNYYHRFIPNSTKILHPLNKLLRKNKKFIWSPECNKAFNKIKEILSSEQVLIPYQRNLPLTLATDASPVGISAILSHKLPEGIERPIAFASRSLSKSEANYSQLDKEALAVFWGAKKFYHYIAGRPFTFIVDNKPVQHIFNPDKNLPTFAAARMLRYATYLSQFDYEIQHRPTEQHKNVDYFSRNPEETYELNVIDECTFLQDNRISNICKTQTISPELLRKETSADPELSTLKETLQNGKADVNYSINNGIIFRGHRIVIPASLQPAILKELHTTHLGIVKMKALARNYVYWRKIDQDIEKIVKSCESCANYSKNPTKVPIHPWQPSSKPFQRIHIDYAGPIFDHQFLIVVDSFSKWLEVYMTKNAPTSEKTIDFLLNFITHYGIPEELVSDNAKIFTSETFTKFTSELQIKQSFIAPGHPATNGQAERFVQFIKDKLKKMSDEPESIKVKLRNILFKYRITPTTNGKTPSEMVFGRNIRNRLDLLKPCMQRKTATSYDQNIRHLKIGQRVLSRNYQSSNQWKFGTVKKCLGKLHYEIQLDNGYVIKRHINQLKTTEVNRDRTKHVTFEDELPILISTQPSRNETLRPTDSLPAEVVDQRAPPGPESTIIAPVHGPTPLRHSTRERKPVIRLNL